MQIIHTGQLRRLALAALPLALVTAHCGSDSPTETGSSHTVVGKVVLQGVETTNAGSTVGPFSVTDASGVAVFLMRGVVVDSTRSAQGAFNFDGVDAGTYHLEARVAQQTLAAGDLFDTVAGDTTTAALLRLPAAAAGAEVQLFPNPYTADTQSRMTVLGLPADASVRILTTSGDLVREIGSSPGATALTWDGTTADGDLVADGSYWVMATDASGFVELALLSVVIDTSGALGPPPAEPASTPEIALDNLERSFNERDKELYETLLDERFWFTEDDCAGNLVLHNDRETEIAIMGPRDGSSRGIFDQFRTIEYDFQLIERRTELGREFPNAFEGDPDGHPEEDWEVFRGRVEILLLESDNEGFQVSQVMTFKLREGDDGLWRMARWIDDVLAGECGGESLKLAEASSWGRIKASFR